MTILRVESDRWEEATADDVFAETSAAAQLVASGRIMNAVSPVGDRDATTIFFRTREAGCGVLQILGATKNPRGLKIRYKRVVPGTSKTPAHKGGDFPTGAHFGGAPCVPRSPPWLWLSLGSLTRPNGYETRLPISVG